MAKKTGKTGIDNLIPTTMRSKEEARELGRKGGIASGKVRREKATMRKALERILQMDIDIVLPDNTKEKSDIATAIILQQVNRAIKKQDTFSAQFLAKLGGEFEEHINFTDKTPQVVVSNEESAKKLKKLLNADNEDI